MKIQTRFINQRKRTWKERKRELSRFRILAEEKSKIDGDMNNHSIPRKKIRARLGHRAAVHRG